MRNKIKQIIKNNGLKISDVIKKTGLAKSYFYNVMNGESVPSLVNARKISDAIGVSINEIFPNENMDKEV